VTVTAAGAGGASGADVRWVVTDQLGTPRMVFDHTGNLTSPDGQSGMTRHDYFPFGEEIGASVGACTTNQGYSQADSVRQKFAAAERDDETGLDFMQARYYSNTQGRFSSVDPLLASGIPTNPKTWNRYAYALNNPLRFSDPTGLMACPPGQTCVDENTPNEHYFDPELGENVYSGTGGSPDSNLTPLLALAGPIPLLATKTVTGASCTAALPVIAGAGIVFSLYGIGERIMDPIPKSPFGMTLADGTRTISCTAGNQALQQLQRVDSPVFSILQNGDLLFD